MQPEQKKKNIFDQKKKKVKENHGYNVIQPIKPIFNSMFSLSYDSHGLYNPWKNQ